MQQKSTYITLETYLDLNQLIRTYKGSHEENRIFALSHKKVVEKQSLTNSNKKLLLLWQHKNLYKVTDELESNNYLQYLNIFSFIFALIVLILGFTTGFALLSYSGSEPVNVIYLLLVMVALPLLSMSLSLLSMLTGNLATNFLNHFSPFYYLEKLLNFFPFDKKVDFSNLPFSLGLSKWIFLQRIQFFSFLFSLGIFVSLLLMIIAKDIAFGWSTTLQVTPESFQGLLSSLGFFWQSFLPSAIPSLELVELSHYFRLGEKLDANMIQNADKLGAWWKFLAMVTLVYALVLRLLFWFMAHYGLNRELKKEFLAIVGVKQLLAEFNTPYVSTQAQNVENHLNVSLVDVSTANALLAMDYHTVLGWNYIDESLLLVQDNFRIKSREVNVVGGRNSFKEDKEIVSKLKESVLVYVKSWEPPTMDFMDFVEELLENKKLLTIDVCPVGTVSNNYGSEKRDLQVWLKKLEQVDTEKLGVINV